MTLRSSRLALAAMLPLLLPACAARHEVAALETAPPPSAVAVPPPTPPAGLTAGLAIPDTDPDGSFRTINHGLSPAETVWHLRAALNVAALGCRGTEAAVLVPGYNGLLKGQKAALAAADKATQARFRTSVGAGWQSAHDVAMTRLYNFFAQPFAQARFCASAAAIVQAAGAVPKGQMEAFAGTALVMLEAPFTDFYRQAVTYRRALAMWQLAQQPAAPRIEPVFDGLDRVAIASPR